MLFQILILGFNLLVGPQDASACTDGVLEVQKYHDRAIRKNGKLFWTELAMLESGEKQVTRKCGLPIRGLFSSQFLPNW